MLEQQKSYYSDFPSDLEDSKSTSQGISCIFGSRTFVPVRWMSSEVANKKVEQLCKVSHPCLDDHQFKKKGGTRISWTIVRSLLTNCLKKLVHGKNWTT